MINLKSVVSKWGEPDFPISLKKELEKMGVNELPLQQGLSSSNIAIDDDIKVIILNSSDSNDALHIKVGIFYLGVIAGCNCTDDPSPMDTQNEYCEIGLDINRLSGDTSIRLLKD